MSERKRFVGVVNFLVTENLVNGNFRRTCGLEARQNGDGEAPRFLSGPEPHLMPRALDAKFQHSRYSDGMTCSKT